MNRLILFVPLILFSGCACSKKKADSTQHTQTAQEAVQPPSAKPDSVPATSSVNNSRNEKDTSASKPSSETVYRFIVSFYSIGEGTEGAQIVKFDAFLLSFRQKSGKKIPAEKSYWGREGEVDYCVDLGEISPSDQLLFINNTKEELKAAKWVHFAENMTCKKKRR